MNVPNTSERVSSGEETRSALSRRPCMLTWQGVDGPRLESVRLLLSESRLRASGRLVVAEVDAEPFSASFELSVGETGAVSRLLLRTTTAADERQVSLGRSADGIWLVDHGQGTERTEFDGALDVDVLGAVLFNTLPIRRLGLHRQAGEHVLPVVFVSLPDLTVRVVEQTYRTRSVGDEHSVVNFSSGTFSADLTVDPDGLVVHYPALARRV